MKLNKRELRKFADPGLKFNPGNGLLLFKKIKHIVRAAVKIIGGKRILTVYFYNREQAAAGCYIPEYTLFQIKNDYIVLYRKNTGELKWQTSCIDNIEEKYGEFIKKCAFYRQNDEQIVTCFCKMGEFKGFAALNELQTAIKSARLIKKNKARANKTIKRMKVIRSVPKDLNNWIHKNVLPHYIFYKYNRSKKPIQGYCTACKRDVLITGPKHNAYGKCTSCGKNIMFKAIGVAKVSDRTTVQLLQKVGENELILRIFKVKHCLHDWRQPNLNITENARFFVWVNKENELQIESYYYDYEKEQLTKWTNGHRPRFSHYQYNFECDICGYLYCRNINKNLAGTSWQYSQLEKFCHIECEPMEVLPYLREYLKYPAIEYIVKLGLTKLASNIIYGYNIYKSQEIINKNGKDFKETFGVSMDALPVLQQVNADIDQLELYQKLTKQGIRVDEQLLAWYKKQAIVSIENILIPIKYSTPLKVMRYVDEQFKRFKNWESSFGVHRYEKPNNILSDYKDYLKMGNRLGYDLTNNFVLFPKNLSETHDQTNKLYNNNKTSIFNKEIQEAYKKLLTQYRFTKNGLTIIPPKTSKEIVDEGHKLHHCVASYVENAATGECVILFIRQIENIEEPFYTVEIMDGRVIQIHGKNHCSPTPEVNKFLEQWKRKKLLAINKIEAV